MLDQQLPPRYPYCVLQTVHSAWRGLPLELSYGLWGWGREVGETELARKPKMTGLAALRGPRRGWHALCMPRPVLDSFDSIVYFVRGVITGWGSPSFHKWGV